MHEKEPLKFKCGYRPCTNTNLTVLFEDDKEIVVWCAEHQAKTYWSKVERPKSQVVKPEFRDIYKAVK